jgi:hypothetical protein
MCDAQVLCYIACDIFYDIYCHFVLKMYMLYKLLLLPLCTISYKPEVDGITR